VSGLRSVRPESAVKRGMGASARLQPFGVLGEAWWYLLASIVALATRFVFRHRRFAARRDLETGLYAATGLAGLVLSAAIVALGSALGCTLAVSKSVAVVASFVAVYAIRRGILFRHPAARQAGDV
jgi:hypothetical protein